LGLNPVAATSVLERSITHPDTQKLASGSSMLQKLWFGKLTKQAVPGACPAVDEVPSCDLFEPAPDDF
jgi:hypothetical protein